MEQPLKAFVLDNYRDFLEGVEVRAGIIGRHDHNPAPGEHVMVFKHSIASETDVPVPKSQQSHYIGIEGTVTAIEQEPSSAGARAILKVKKL